MVHNVHSITVYYTSSTQTQTHTTQLLQKVYNTDYCC